MIGAGIVDQPRDGLAEWPPQIPQSWRPSFLPQTLRITPRSRWRFPRDCEDYHSNDILVRAVIPTTIAGRLREFASS